VTGERLDVDARAKERDDVIAPDAVVAPALAGFDEAPPERPRLGRLDARLDDVRAVAGPLHGLIEAGLDARLDLVHHDEEALRRTDLSMGERQRSVLDASARKSTSSSRARRVSVRPRKMCAGARYWRAAATSKHC
jgi:hypothetical protein